MPILKVQTNAKMVRKGLEDLRAEIPKVGRARMYDALFRAMQRLKKPGKKPKYPIPWDSIRQMKKVIAMLRKRNNLPYKRTGAYQRAYRIRRLQAGHELSNPAPSAKYVGGTGRGERRSRIHAGRWPLMRDEVDKELLKLPSAVVQHIKIVARQKGFQTR
jgi:hypothetical protein